MEVGDQVGNFLVLKKFKKNGNTYVTAKCCVCNETKNDYRPSELKRTKTCRMCYVTRGGKVGEVYGNFTIVEVLPYGQGHRKVNVKCVCGDILKNRTLSYLKMCKDTIPHPTCRKCSGGRRKRPETEKMYRRYFSQVEEEINISVDEFTNLVNSNCFYCGESPETINEELPLMFKNLRPINGLDRVDSTKGYDINNVVPCCRLCNMMKRNLPINVFIAHVNKITHFQMNGQSAAKH